METIGVAEKERLIQTGRRHYSTMLSRETLPSPRYMEIFRDTFVMTRRRMARGILDLAAIIGSRRQGEITLVSLARAGLPVGVVLKHVLGGYLGRQVAHYSISIIRDRGLDRNALGFILNEESRDAAGIIFVDGWTGKGVIACELAKSIADFNRLHGLRLDSSLYTLTDLAGVGIAPSDDDYLIPSSVMNATMSGLISRSILNEGIGPGQFHGCVYYQEFKREDLSIWFVDELLKDIRAMLDEGYQPCPTPVDPVCGRERSRRLLTLIEDRFGTMDRNLIKPGIGEATRVLLRRVPERIMVRDQAAPEVAHLLQLAREKEVHWDVDPSLPYQAVSLIKGFSDA